MQNTLKYTKIIAVC